MLERDRAAARELRSRGVHVTIATGGLHYGRRSLAIRPYLSDWGECHEVHEDLHASEDWQAADLLSIGVVGSRDEVAALRCELEPSLPEGEGLVEFDAHTGERFLSLRHAGGAVAEVAEVVWGRPTLSSLRSRGGPLQAPEPASSRGAERRRSTASANKASADSGRPPARVIAQLWGSAEP